MIWIARFRGTPLSLVELAREVPHRDEGVLIAASVLEYVASHLSIPAAVAVLVVK
jgi:hypothetical protein